VLAIALVFVETKLRNEEPENLHNFGEIHHLIKELVRTHNVYLKPNFVQSLQECEMIYESRLSRDNELEANTLRSEGRHESYDRKGSVTIGHLEASMGTRPELRKSAKQNCYESYDRKGSVTGTWEPPLAPSLSF